MSAKEPWVKGTEGPKLGHALDHLYDQDSTTEREGDSMRNVEANALAYAQTRDSRFVDPSRVTVTGDDMVTGIADEDSTPAFVKDDERLGWESREPEPWCNHDAVAVVDGVCECGAIVENVEPFDWEAFNESWDLETGP
jgi:hypothetical protein